MPEILFLTPEFPPSKLTGGMRPAKFSKYLSRFGWDVTVLTFDHQDDTNLRILKDLENVRIEKCGIPKKIIVNDLGVSYFFQAYKQAISLAKSIKPDYVLVSMPTFMNSILALILKKKFNINYILDYRDLWVGDPYPPRGVKSKLFRLLSKAIEPAILKSAYLSYYVSDNMLSDQLKLYPFLKNKKTAIISTGYDPEDIKNIIPSPQKNGYISHIGNADPDMNIEDFVSIVRDVTVQEKLKSLSVKFLFVGRKNEFIKNVIDDSLKEFFEFKDYMPHNEALQLMSDSTGLLILGSNSAQRLNRKVFEYTALNNNVFYLGNVDSPTAKVVHENGGVVSDLVSCKVSMLEYLGRDVLPDQSKSLSAYEHNVLVEKLMKYL